MMADGALVRTLVHTDVTKYLQFKVIFLYTCRPQMIKQYLYMIIQDLQNDKKPFCNPSCSFCNIMKMI